ncbi:MAG: hypothetical protein A3K19_21130 [Lentisphaerae bacterium RIFOXYB12_FULL_65_16]|nr:MAG: hypothetical protein A3K18_08085 [Lentisphaerae bacterium RIFOXYA12_64_32]OGV93984.1 MAG: hypothetical protein A3K19_21130 [Lentisphaerae bacterium RIFOXYB12_FULL_65_16]
MKPRLSLVAAPLTLSDRYGAFAQAANTEPSFGLVCLAAVARETGAEVLIVEAAAENLGVNRTLARLLPFHPHVVGISATTAGICAAAELAAQVKAQCPQTYVLVGGCHVTALPEESLREFPAFDLIAIGEGEATLRELLQRLAQDGRLPLDVAGTAARKDGLEFRNPPRPIIANLDELPLPAWSLLPGFPKAFRPAPMRIRRWPCASIVLSRGCPNQCSFCDRSVFGSQCRAYSPEYAVRLIRDLRDNYGVQEILLEDDTFTLSRQRVSEFCDRLLSERLNITWSCLARADRVTPELLHSMRRAGCWHISYGIESGDPELLKAMHKNLDLTQIEAALRWSKEAGLRTKGFFMTGFPGETRESLATTATFALSLPLDEVSVMQLTPFPGSELYQQADVLGTMERDWRRMNTLNTVFVPNGLTREDLDAARDKLMRRFYLRPCVLLDHLRALFRRPRLLGPMLRAVLALLRGTKRGVT